jgi:hypothetical protein
MLAEVSPRFNYLGSHAFDAMLFGFPLRLLTHLAGFRLIVRPRLADSCSRGVLPIPSND